MSFNPWNVGSFEEFLYFCCPQCDIKTKATDELVKHGLKFHELAKISKIGSLHVKT